MKVLKWLDKHLEEMLLVILLAAIVLVMLYQIVRRYLFNSSLSWSEEFCRYCFIWFMFVAFSYSIRLKSDLRVDAVLNLLPGGVRRGLEWFNLILCLAVTAFLFYSSFGSVAYVAKTGETSTGLHLPFTYLYASMVVGFGLGTFRYIQRIVLEMKGKKEPKEEQK